MKKNIKTKNLILTIICFSAAFFLTTSFAFAYSYTPMEKIPGFESAEAFPEYVASIYKFGIWTIGIAALLMISIGGFMYITAAGNTSNLEKAKNVIRDAIWGIIAALAAWLLLYVINPDLIKGNISSISTMEIPPAAVTTPSPQPVSPAPACVVPVPLTSNCYCLNPAIPCVDCNNCVEVTGIKCKEANCFLNSGLLAKLQAANGHVPFRITEPWPPTVYHKSTCHTDGSCADVNTMSGTTNPTDVKKLYDALVNAGLNPLYESTNCDPYIAVGVTCKYYSTMTSPSFHVKQ